MLWLIGMLIISLWEKHLVRGSSFGTTTSRNVIVSSSLTPSPEDVTCTGSGCKISIAFNVVHTCSNLGMQVSVVPTDYTPGTTTEYLSIYAGQQLLYTCSGMGQLSGRSFSNAVLCFTATFQGWPTLIQMYFHGGSGLNVNAMSGTTNTYVGVRVQWSCFSSVIGQSVSYSPLNNAPASAPLLRPVVAPTPRPTSRPTRGSVARTNWTGIIVGVVVGSIVLIGLIVGLTACTGCCAASKTTVAVTATASSSNRNANGQTVNVIQMQPQPGGGTQPGPNQPYAYATGQPGQAAPMYASMQPQYAQPTAQPGYAQVGPGGYAQPQPGGGYAQPYPMYNPGAPVAVNPGAPGGAPVYQPYPQAGNPGGAPPSYAPSGNPGGAPPPAYGSGAPPAYGQASDGGATGGY